MPDPPAAREVPTLRGARLLLRSGRPEDEASLRAVFAAPEVRRWWPTPDDAELAEALASDLLRGEVLDA